MSTEPPVPSETDDQLEIQRIELERERLGVESLRLQAQIQTELARFELALQEYLSEAAEEVAGDVAVVPAHPGPPSMQKFEPDLIAFEQFRETLGPYGEWVEGVDYGRRLRIGI